MAVQLQSHGSATLLRPVPASLQTVHVRRLLLSPRAIARGRELIELTAGGTFTASLAAGSGDREQQLTTFLMAAAISLGLGMAARWTLRVPRWPLLFCVGYTGMLLAGISGRGNDGGLVLAAMGAAFAVALLGRVVLDLAGAVEMEAPLLAPRGAAAERSLADFYATTPPPAIAVPQREPARPNNACWAEIPTEGGTWYAEIIGFRELSAEPWTGELRMMLMNCATIPLPFRPGDFSANRALPRSISVRPCLVPPGESLVFRATFVHARKPLRLVWAPNGRRADLSLPLRPRFR